MISYDNPYIYYFSWGLIYLTLCPLLMLIIFPIAGLRLKLMKNNDRTKKKKVLSFWIRTTGIIFVSCLSIQFSYVKTISESANTKINFYDNDKFTKIVDNKCIYKINDNQQSFALLRYFLPEKLVYKRADIIKTPSCGSFKLLNSTLETLANNSEVVIPKYVKRFTNHKIRRDIAAIDDNQIREENIISTNEKIMSYEDFVFSVAIYSFISMAFFLGVVKFWYESSSSLYRHFNDNFVNVLLKFNLEKNVERKKAYAERLFQLLKEEYLIFYKHNFVYGVDKFSVINLKFWRNNILYVLGTNQYLDEWFTMMENIATKINNNPDYTIEKIENSIQLGNKELETYFYQIYLNRSLKNKLLITMAQKAKEAREAEEIDKKREESFLRFIKEAHDR